MRTLKHHLPAALVALLAILLYVGMALAEKKSAANSTPPAPESISAEDAQAFEAIARDAELLAAKAEAARLRAQLAQAELQRKYKLVDGDTVDPKTRAITRKGGGK